MQNQRDIVGLRLCRATAGRPANEVNVTLLAHFHGENWNLAVESRSARVFRSYRGAKQNARVGIAEKKMKFFVRVRGV